MYFSPPLIIFCDSLNFSMIRDKNKLWCDLFSLFFNYELRDVKIRLRLSSFSTLISLIGMKAVKCCFTDYNFQWSFMHKARGSFNPLPQAGSVCTVRAVCLHTFVSLSALRRCESFRKAIKNNTKCISWRRLIILDYLGWEGSEINDPVKMVCVFRG